jgi:hypothetical protein
VESLAPESGERCHLQRVRVRGSSRACRPRLNLQTQQEIQSHTSATRSARWCGGRHACVASNSACAHSFSAVAICHSIHGVAPATVRETKIVHVQLRATVEAVVGNNPPCASLRTASIHTQHQCSAASGRRRSGVCPRLAPSRAGPGGQAGQSIAGEVTSGGNVHTRETECPTVCKFPECANA